MIVAFGYAASFSVTHAFRPTLLAAFEELSLCGSLGRGRRKRAESL